MVHAHGCDGYWQKIRVGLVCSITWKVNQISRIKTKNMSRMLALIQSHSGIGSQMMTVCSGSASNFRLGATAQEVWGLPQWVQGRNPPEDKSVCRYCLQILTAETIKIWKFRTILLLILDQYLSRCGTKRHFAYDWRRHATDSMTH